VPARDEFFELGELGELGSRGDKPHINPAVDFTSLRLTPTEAFVLSRIDGSSSYDEICRMSSLGREQTLAILVKLKAEKVVLVHGQTSPSGDKAPRSMRSSTPDRYLKTPIPVAVTDEMLRQAQERSGGKPAQAQPAPRSVLERLDDGSPVNPSDLIEGPDLSEETKQRILRLHRRVRKLAPHELLGVEPDVDVATIKRVFAAASKELHPDRYFGKELGCFRDKLAKIFNRVSEAAHELEKARKAKK